ncbi:MAG: arsenic resistance N-acetyltransferase ArsN2 [Halobacteriales archaeon]
MDSARDLTLRRATSESIDRVLELLRAHELPHADLPAKVDRFYLGYAGERMVAVGGLEQRGRHGLLRSVVVKEAERGQGYGVAVCGAIEDRAAESGIRSLYLLTTTAAPFFRTIGYRQIPRKTAPEAIRATTEFADYCPDSATCMRKDINNGTET